MKNKLILVLVSVLALGGVAYIGRGSISTLAESVADVFTFTTVHAYGFSSSGYGAAVHFGGHAGMPNVHPRGMPDPNAAPVAQPASSFLPAAPATALPLDFIIGNGSGTTYSQNVAIAMNADPKTVKGYAISLDPKFTNEGIKMFFPTIEYTLPEKKDTYTLYLKYYSVTGDASETISHTVAYKDMPVVAAPVAEQATTPVVTVAPVEAAPVKTGFFHTIGAFFGNTYHKIVAFL